MPAMSGADAISIPFRFTIRRQIRLITNTNGDTDPEDRRTGWTDLLDQDQLGVLDQEPSSIAACSWLSSGLEAGSSDDSFNSLVALVISCSSAATAWRLPGDAARALQIIDADQVLEYTLGLPARAPCRVTSPRQVGHGRLLVGLGDVKAIHRLGESQVGIDTGDDDASINGEQLDAHKGQANVNIDDQALVQDRVDDISETARRGAVEVSVGRVGCDSLPRRVRRPVDAGRAVDDRRLGRQPLVAVGGRVRLAGPDDSAGSIAMPRRRLSPGEWGEVSVSRSPGGLLYRARAWFRDFDGVRRMVERDARTEWAARTALGDRLGRAGSAGRRESQGLGHLRSRGGRVAGPGGAVGEAGPAVAGNCGDVFTAAERACAAGSWGAAARRGHDTAGGSVCDRRA